MGDNKKLSVSQMKLREKKRKEFAQRKYREEKCKEREAKVAKRNAAAAHSAASPRETEVDPPRSSPAALPPSSSPEDSPSESSQGSQPQQQRPPAAGNPPPASPGKPEFPAAQDSDHAKPNTSPPSPPSSLLSVSSPSSMELNSTPAAGPSPRLPGESASDALIRQQSCWGVPDDLERKNLRRAKKTMKQRELRGRLKDARNSVDSWERKVEIAEWRREKKQKEREKYETREKALAEIAEKEGLDAEDLASKQREATMAAMVGQEVIDLDLDEGELQVSLQAIRPSAYTQQE